MIADACFEVAEVLSGDGARPSAVERALNAFADHLSDAESHRLGPIAAFAELRAGIANVNRAALPAAAFAEMAKAVQRYFDAPQAPDPAPLVLHLRAINATANPHAGLRAHHVVP
jgi:hypothetical protein